jgi:hypothetical protein
MIDTAGSEHLRRKSPEVISIYLRDIEQGMDSSELVRQGYAITSSKGSLILGGELQQDGQGPDLTSRQTVGLEDGLERLPIHEPGEWGIRPVAELLTIHEVPLVDREAREVNYCIEVEGLGFTMNKTPTMRFDEKRRCLL